MRRGPGRIDCWLTSYGAVAELLDLCLSDPGNVEIARDHTLVQTVEVAHTQVFPEKPFVGYRAIDSDAIVLSGYGIPSINYGVGQPIQALSIGPRPQAWTVAVRSVEAHPQ